MIAPDVFASLDEAIRAATPEELPDFAGRLRAAELRVELRLRGEANGNGHRPEPESPETLLTVEAAVQAIGSVSRKWLLRHTRGLRFRRDLSRKVVRFERCGLLRWAAARRA